MNAGSGGGQLKPKVESFTGKGVSLGGENKKDKPSDLDAALAMQYGEDPELIAAIKASMAEEESKSMIVAQEPDKNTDP